MQILDAQAGPNLVTDPGPGGCNDPEMLEVRVKGFTENGNSDLGLPPRNPARTSACGAMFNAPLMEVPPHGVKLYRL